MGYYTEYLNQNLNFEALALERKKQLKIISTLRDNRDILVFAADINKQIPLISINYADLLPIKDQIANLHNDRLDLILETPGGSGEVAEDIVRLLREKYKEIGVIVPGYAKSAGTIMAMSADEILMGPSISSLGPIDAQLFWQGKIFSADAFLDGLEKIKEEVEKTGILNKAYIPILQGISPGEIQSATNALNFAQKLVTNWLAQYKFKNWDNHSKTGTPVTAREKEERAKEIAERLCDHQNWLTHARSIKLHDLEDMGLRITDYSKKPELEEAIDRYYTLLEMSFSSTLYKLFETKDTQINRFIAQMPASQLKALNPAPPNARMATIGITCKKCQSTYKIQINLDKDMPLEKGSIPFPSNSRFKCQKCGLELDLAQLKLQVEKQTGKKIVL